MFGALSLFFLLKIIGLSSKLHGQRGMFVSLSPAFFRYIRGTLFGSSAQNNWLISKNGGRRCMFSFSLFLAIPLLLFCERLKT
jgi:hypothetical protein